MKEKRFKKVYIEITNICNLKCSFCPETKRAKAFMSIENFEHIINEVKEYTNLVTFHVKGEPLLHPNLKEFLEICNKNNILVNITTNASLLEKNVEILINSPAVRQINLSLHSMKENKEYNFENYIEDCLKYTNRILENSNIIISYRLWNLDNIEENSENAEILEKLGKFFEKDNLIEDAKKNKFVKLRENAFLNQDIEFSWPSLENEIISEEGSCLGLRNQVAILVNGDVVPCCLDQEGDIKLGNIYEENFEKIINSEMSKKIVKGFQNGVLIHNLCKRCGYRNRF